MHAIWKTLFGLLSFVACSTSHADSFPSRPIRLVVPFTAGGPPDAVARPLANAIQERLGQPVVIENLPGAAGNLGATQVARAKPDGYTILLGTSVTFGINPNLYNNLPYRALEDFTPVAAVTLTPSILVINPALPIHNLAELIDYARRNPGKLRYASSGYGSVGHLNGAQLATRAGIEMMHVPYKGSTQAINDIIGGHVDMIFEPTMTSLPLIKSNTLRALAISSITRSAVIPDLPTIDEAGLPGFDYSGWYGIVAPTGTPPAVLDQLNGAIVSALKDPRYIEILKTGGTSPAPMSRDDFRKLLQTTYDRSKKVIADYGLTPN